jgi:hypothetical protein
VTGSGLALLKLASIRHKRRNIALVETSHSIKAMVADGPVGVRDNVVRITAAG